MKVDCARCWPGDKVRDVENGPVGTVTSNLGRWTDVMYPKGPRTYKHGRERLYVVEASGRPTHLYEPDPHEALDRLLKENAELKARLDAQEPKRFYYIAVGSFGSVWHVTTDRELPPASCTIPPGNSMAVNEARCIYAPNESIWTVGDTLTLLYPSGEMRLYPTVA